MTTPVTLLENPDGRWLMSRTEVLQAKKAPPEVAGPVLRQYLGRVRITAPFFGAQAGDPVPEFVREAPRERPRYFCGVRNLWRTAPGGG